MRLLSGWWRRDADHARWDTQAHQATVAQLPGMAALATARLAQLEQLARSLARDKRFHCHDGSQPSAAQITTITTLASWPMQNLGPRAFAGWRDLVLYPAGFRARRQLLEAEQSGLELIHEYDEDLSGEASELGVIVLAWDEICQDLAHPEDGQSVVIHEVAHLFDGLSGAMDGRPPLLPGMSAAVWTDVFQTAYDALRASLSADRESLMDPYAAEAPEEFFAVALEHYCLRPDWLLAECPAVHAQLHSLFGTVTA